MAVKEPFLAPELHDHARAIGIVCVLWGQLEMFLNALLRNLMAIPGDPTASHTIENNMEMRAKLRVIVGLGYLKVPNAKWFVVLKWAMDTIDNDLRTRRNRFVHDQWMREDGGLVKRIEAKTGLRKIPPSGTEEFFTKVEHVVAVDQINQLGQDIDDMSVRVFALILGVKERPEYRDGLPELLADIAPLPPDLKV